jgi:hypothetical protein
MREISASHTSRARALSRQYLQSKYKFCCTAPVCAGAGFKTYGGICVLDAAGGRRTFGGKLEAQQRDPSGLKVIQASTTNSLLDFRQIC